jgi:SEC-C motif
MSKIGRNDLCPCGSGKKYKHCHLNKDGNFASGTATPNSAPAFMNFVELIKNYNSIQIIGLLGALQLNPVNHGRNFRFEQMIRETLLQFNPDDKRPLASWGTLKTTIENYETGKSYEDPLTNAFTEAAIFEEGNYVVYSGIYVGFTEILNQLTECIFLQKNNLNKEFVKKVRDAIGLLLFMSNSAAKDAGQDAYIYEEENTGDIELPEYDQAVRYTDAIYFPREFLTEVCTRHGYDHAIIEDFLLVPGSSELNDDDPDNNIVNFKPLIEVNNDIILYMPTGVANAIIDYIYSKAKVYNCYDELLDLLYARQFHLSCVALAKTGWLATDIELPPYKGTLSIEETVFQFDNQKLAYICYINSGKKVIAVDKSAESKQPDPYGSRTNEVVQYLSNINPKQPINVFCLYIIAEVAQDFYFMWSKPSAGNQSLALTYRELWTIAHSEKIDSLSLWKFAKCYSRTNELTRIMAMGGTMDAYAIYRKNHGSLLNSDDANPLGGMLMIVNGSSDDFRREVQKKENEHAVPIFYKGQLAYAKVTRFKDYAPIYIEREISNNFRIVIESYKMPIWITNTQTKLNKESWATYACEAVAFWLNKMVDQLSPFINKQSLIQFEIEIIADEKLLHAEEYVIKDVKPENIVLNSEVVAPTLKISVPFEFLYAVILPDNTADIILMKAVLNGLILYIETSGNTTELNKKVIDEIVETTLRPKQAKMLLFSDASANIKMDNRHLPSLRYIKDTDVSYILDNLTSYLPKGYVIPTKIADKPSKIKLCDDVVIALITQITNKLTEFDGEDLLKWLIRRNEKCIQVREFREILIPARIACFSDIDSEIEGLMDGEKNLVTTAHATRTLIEFVASKIPTGSKWPNLDDIDELLALTNQLTEWGSLSEAMRLNLEDPEMGLLPSGRIGTEKTLEREAFKPYAVAKNESEVFRNVESFESNYVPARKTGPAIATDESRELDTAFKAEFGITLTTLSKIIGALVNEGFIKAESCVVIEKENLIDILKKIDGLTSENVNISISLLTLLERDAIGVPPQSYTSLDIFTWRYNRSISYIRRPLVQVNQADKIYYYYGYRHLMQFIDNLFYLLYSSKLPNPKTDEMKSWLAEVSGDKGKPFRKEVKEWFEQNTDFQVIPHEVKMDKQVPSGHLQTDKHYGDIDLLVIDHAKHIIYPIECKNISGGRNVHEMKVEMDDYLGRDGKDKKAKMRKHVERDKWLNENKAALSQFVTGIDQYSIRSLILTADEIPLAYIKKDDLPLPVKSFVFLRKNGITYLAE